MELEANKLNLTNRKIYVSGPMTGIPNYNRPLFEKVTAELRELGNKVYSPPEDEDPQHQDTWENYLNKDIPLVAWADTFVMLPGWENSKGATLEVGIAALLKKDVFEYETGGNVHPNDIKFAFQKMIEKHMGV